MNFQTLAPYLGATGQALIDLDENKTGAEDFAGALLVYAAEVIGAIGEEGDLPPFPDALRNGVADRITGAFRATLIVANTILTVARFQTSGRAAIALRYITQALSQLAAGQPVPAPPSVLI